MQRPPSTETLHVFNTVDVWRRDICKLILAQTSFLLPQAKLQKEKWAHLKDKGCPAKYKYCARIFQWKKTNERFSKTVGFISWHCPWAFTTETGHTWELHCLEICFHKSQIYPHPPDHLQEALALSSTSARGNHPGFAPREPSGNWNRLCTWNNIFWQGLITYKVYKAGGYSSDSGSYSTYFTEK